MLWLPLAARAEEEPAPSSGDLHVEVTEETMEDVPVTLPGGGNAPEETPETPSPGGAGDAETPAPPPAAVMPNYVVAPAGDAEATYQIEEGSWVDGTLTEAFRAVSDGGTIKLLRDKDATLLGDGHSVCLERGSILVDGTGKLNLGREGESGTLIISSKDDPNCIINLRGSGTLHMYEGVTLGPSRAGGQPAGVFLEQNASFTMHGGTIKDCENWAAVTGGVMVTGDARFTMEGGEIRNCKGYLGDAVGLNPGTAIGPDTSGNASFVMTGGKITNCTDVSNGGGAVFAYTARAVTVDIRGGEITGCSTTAGNGGGLFLYVNNRNATVNLSGVPISGCTARHGGALALLRTCKATIGDGTVLRDNIPTAPRISNPSGITTSPGPSSIMGCCTVSLPPGGTRSGPRCSGTGRWPSGGNLPTGSMKTAPRCPTAAVWGTGSASVPSNLPVCLRDWNPCPWM